MRRSTITLLVLAAAAVGGCGSSGTHFANLPKPPSPINVTVYINDQRVSISPSATGAGPVVFTVTNQASTAQSMTVLPAGTAAGQSVANTGPISPQATAQIKVQLNTGSYLVATGSAQDAATTSGIRPARLVIGRQRPSSSGQLMNP